VRILPVKKKPASLKALGVWSNIRDQSWTTKVCRRDYFPL